MSCLSFGLTSFALCGHWRESKENVWSHEHLLPHFVLLVSPDSAWSIVRPRPTKGFESVGLWSIASQSVGILDWARSSRPGRPSVRSFLETRIGEET